MRLILYLVVKVLRMLHKAWLLLLLVPSVPVSAQLMNLRNWKKTERDSLSQALALYEEKKHLQALPIFESILLNHPNEEFLKFSYAKCALLSPEKQSDAYRNLTEVYGKNHKAPDIQFYLALAGYYNSNFDEAFNYINSYLAGRKLQPEARRNAEALKRNINYARYYSTHPTRAKIFNLGRDFNSAANEFIPAMSAAETQLLFNYSVSGVTTSDSIFSALKNEDELSAPHAIGNDMMPGGYQVLSLSNDGQTLFLRSSTVDGKTDLYYSRHNGLRFGAPQKIKGEVNSAWHENYCSLSPDGQTLYFSSDRLGGHGGSDLYCARLSQDSMWVDVRNLGDSINTSFDEESPFIHADGKTLFFSSKGHSNMGGFDVFRSMLNVRDSSFKKAENLGYPVNSVLDEVYFIISADSYNAYFTSNRRDGRGQWDIYHAETNFRGQRPSLCLLRGKVSLNDDAVGARIVVWGGGSKPFATLYANAASGMYLVALPTGREYQLEYQHGNLPSQKVNVDLLDMTGFVEKIKNVKMDEPGGLVSKTAEPQSRADGSATLTPRVTATIQPSATESHQKEKITAHHGKETGHQNMHHPDYKSIKPDQQRMETEATVYAEDESVFIPKTMPEDQHHKKVKTLNDVERHQANVDAHLIEESQAETETPTQPVTKEPAPSPAKTNAVPVEKESARMVLPNDGFEPNNEVQEKIMANAYKYGNIAYDSLEFRVQVAAYKNNEHYFFPRLEKFGKLEKVELGDGYKRLMLGGSFKTYGRAFAYAKKIIRSGHDDVYIVVVYKGYRYTVEDLEEIGIFK